MLFKTGAYSNNGRRQILFFRNDATGETTDAWKGLKASNRLHAHSLLLWLSRENPNRLTGKITVIAESDCSRKHCHQRL